MIRRQGAFSVAPASRGLKPAALCARRGFTLIELLVVVAIVAVLISILLPSLAMARKQARQVVCGSNLRQLGYGFHMYAYDHRGMAMPLAYTDREAAPDGEPTYWWGKLKTMSEGPVRSGVDHTQGFVWPYLQSDLRTDGVYECPAQPWGSYAPQGATQQDVTSTYGYNGYFLSPPHASGWSYSIGDRPWQNIDELRNPARLFVFGDAMLELGGRLQNNALLDPPWIYQRPTWRRNTSPTTSFRHRDRTQMVHADGHVALHGPGDYLPSAQSNHQLRKLWDAHRIGAVGRLNDPHYVPDWREWARGR